MNKQALLDHCKQFLENREKTVHGQMEQLRESLTSETKSSAGDKHETGRAMVQLEMEKLSRQLLELEKARNMLRRVNIMQNTDAAHLGSLVQTDTAYYFLAISCDVFQEDGSKVFCVSTHAPIARALMGKKKGDSVLFNGITYTVLDIH
ncbi:3-oxoacyl-ACP synthase [Muricauda sp. JGD-17]|uniref:3-oxoacyl-ACP synthase n=1 Tax=Flagellimonas ochracea TaxID=2696472 RepID=A0A964WX52_9FLAO|nr:GreA/GreB family elongation factor [Allomuricauda ochracea]NAY91766.1 3-oxoacyl-ACP synthase [Allomuricauda ochracea]